MRETLPFASLFSVAGSSMAALFAGGFIITWLLVDLVMARGLLQRKIFYVQALLLSGAAVWSFNVLAVSLPGFKSGIAVMNYCFILSALFIIVVDLLRFNEGEYIIDKSGKLPSSYIKNNYLKFFWETLLRLFPSPVPIGLYPLNDADENAPVLLTGNFSLTVRRLARSSGDFPVWILVADSRGINVWCSTLAGHFNTADIIKAIQCTSLVRKVAHRRIVLPQLAAAGVSLENLNEETGFTGIFGPHSCRDIIPYLRGEKSEAFRLAAFGLAQRIEMAIGSPIILLLFLALVYNFIDLSKFMVLLPLLYLFSLIHGAVFPVRPVKNIYLWSLLCGFAAGGAGVVSALLAGHPLFPLSSAFVLAAGCCYLVNEFTGWSPLLKYNIISCKRPLISVNAVSCTGCRRCVQVCPRGVFSFTEGRAKAIAPEKCVSCKSCYRQCPAGAVRHFDGPEC